MKRIMLMHAMLAIASCASTSKAPVYAQAVAVPDTPLPRTIIVPAPQAPAGMPGQMKRLPSAVNKPGPKPPPQKVVADANKRAAQSPDPKDTFNAIVQYSYEPGTLYQVFAAPMRITDLALQPGERIVGQPACGDTVRWVLAQGESIDHGVAQSHIYLKPTRSGLETNLAINTDRHAYMLELHSYEETYMAAINWRYPQEEVVKSHADAVADRAKENEASPVVGLSSLNFNYEVKVVKGKPAWTPIQAFDDGRRAFIRFPQAMLVREAPALFVLRNKEIQLVNYRVKDDVYVVDRLFDAAELHVGGKDAEEIVRITRTGSKH